MPDETESAAAAWLDNSGTKREIDIIGQRFPDWEHHEKVMFALMIEILANLNIYGEPGPDEVFPEPEDDEPWRRP